MADASIKLGPITPGGTPCIAICQPSKWRGTPALHLMIIHWGDYSGVEDALMAHPSHFNLSAVVQVRSSAFQCACMSRITIYRPLPASSVTGFYASGIPKFGCYCHSLFEPCTLLCLTGLHRPRSSFSIWCTYLTLLLPFDTFITRHEPRHCLL